jgi:hypothetical protein
MAVYSCYIKMSIDEKNPKSAIDFTQAPFSGSCWLKNQPERSAEPLKHVLTRGGQLNSSKKPLTQPHLGIPLLLNSTLSYSVFFLSKRKLPGSHADLLKQPLNTTSHFQPYRASMKNHLARCFVQPPPQRLHLVPMPRGIQRVQYK